MHFKLALKFSGMPCYSRGERINTVLVTSFQQQICAFIPGSTDYKEVQYKAWSIFTCAIQFAWVTLTDVWAELLKYKQIRYADYYNKGIMFIFSIVCYQLCKLKNLCSQLCLACGIIIAQLTPLQDILTFSRVVGKLA